LFNVDISQIICSIDIPQIISSVDVCSVVKPLSDSVCSFLPSLIKGAHHLFWSTPSLDLTVFPASAGQGDLYQALSSELARNLALHGLDITRFNEINTNVSNLMAERLQITNQIEIATNNMDFLQTISLESRLVTIGTEFNNFVTEYNNLVDHISDIYSALAGLRDSVIVNGTEEMVTQLSDIRLDGIPVLAHASEFGFVYEDGKWYMYY
jgi:hypothetical protein